MFNFLPDSLSISCVIYDTAPAVIARTIGSLNIAVEHARRAGNIKFGTLYLINNCDENSELFNKLIAQCHQDFKFDQILAFDGHGNIGYGKANNLAIFDSNNEFHLILNPDVQIEEQAISVGVKYLKQNTNVCLTAPLATNPTGDIEYLAKRHPSPFIILLRGINNRFFNKIFQNQLDKYSYRDISIVSEPLEIELASGCFMLCRTASLQKAKGFSEKYFLYFEDFDLSMKLRKFGKLVHLPTMKIIHYGGNTSKKSLKHHWYFFRSSLNFFYHH